MYLYPINVGKSGISLFVPGRLFLNRKFVYFHKQLSLRSPVTIRFKIGVLRQIGGGAVFILISKLLLRGFVI